MKTKLLLLAFCGAFILSCKKDNVTVDPAPVPSPVVAGLTDSTGNFYFPKDYKPGKIMEIKIGGKSIFIEKNSNRYLLEGDILLTEEQVNLLQQRSSGQNARAFINGYNKRWPGGEIPYTINGNVNSTGTTIISGAIQHWQTNTSIRFVPRTTQSDYVEFTASATENNSYVGRTGGKQIINFMVNQGFAEGALIHEIGHATGLFHEQSRTDRNNFILINWSNIKPDVAHNFETYIEGGYSGSNLGTFDFNSIMLYSSIISDPDFVYNTSIPTITRLNGTTYPTNYTSLSAGDIETVAYMYGPPYARLHQVNIYNNPDPSGGSAYQSRDTWYIQFFSDRQRTIPFTLPAGKTVNLMVYKTLWEPSFHNYILYLEPLQVTLPAGAQTYEIGTWDSYENSTSGIVYDGVNYQLGMDEAY